MNLKFNADDYTVQTVEEDGYILTYRAFENIPYVKYPKDERIQVLNIYVPEHYYSEGSEGRLQLNRTPIFMPNSVGGYMPGSVEKPGKDIMGKTNAIFYALKHGYVVVSPGVRGRTMKDSNGKYIGTAPAAICDLKAVVRYLHYNAERIPGDVGKIISNGTSAGGALSSLLAASGNHPDYEKYMQEMGAAEGSDAIFAASCYCPITNLEHADMAYEWEFCGLNDYYGKLIAKNTEGAPKLIKVDGVMTKEQQEMSVVLKNMFPSYVNSLSLTDENGRLLSLDGNGEGTFVDFICDVVRDSMQRELEKGGNLSALEWAQIEENKVEKIDFRKYIAFRTRMKDTPAFDNIGLGTAETELFGTADIQYRHFTEFGYRHSSVNGKLAEKGLIRMMNPMNYIDDEKCTTAKYYRIRHGAADRDTSLAISALLVAKLKNSGVKVDFTYPWGVSHSGDYDLEELFHWIDEISSKKR